MTTVPQTSGIYKWTCTANRKVYIGSAVNLRLRWRDHRSALRNDRHVNALLQRSWNKYGEDTFVFEVIELVLAPFLLEREQYYLDRLKSYDRNKGFNIYSKAGSPYGRVVSEESRRKMSESHKKRVAALTPEERATFYANRRGSAPRVFRNRKPRSPETREKIRQSLRARYGTIDPIPPRAPKVRIKVEKVKRTPVPFSREYEITTPDGELMRIKNLRKFARENGLNYYSLRNVLRRQGTKHKGWGCRLID